MKKEFLILLMCLIITTFTACKKEKTNQTPILSLGGETWAKGPLDVYIKVNFTDPYNIEVKYKWDPYEIAFNKNIAPVKEENVIPALDAVKEIWMKTYEKVAGQEFVRKFTPRQFVMSGSAEYNTDGTITLGEAEGGKRIGLAVINSYDRKNLDVLTQMLHTVHHEFAHILHQNKLYPREFKQLNPEWYTASWFNTSTKDANAQGLVTPYSKAAADEDFVETISFLLVEGQVKFDAIVAANPGNAADILRRKEKIIVDYFQKSYGIDFRALQREVKAGITVIMN
ncbi:zinc-binding metallopeptidase [Pedobacter caeni]|uniref:Substrate import-associated zinc metallohydrolase lipoprotein n=1 Tax=Pedobacter caeni TaxID=288992 RepID=A0A1M5HJ58_9SPHI|nr:putative zinc-binding metallopeptidase [Pedobacter caeni]SHG16009.1 substrate import-associated zinc metallohydrolase lipoprotein [Pedobacter caeni]